MKKKGKGKLRRTWTEEVREAQEKRNRTRQNTSHKTGKDGGNLGKGEQENSWTDLHPPYTLKGKPT